MIGTLNRGTGRRAGALTGLFVIASFALGGCAHDSAAHQAAPTTPVGTYGGLPSYLPTSGIVADSVLTGTADHPALTTQGDAVRVILPTGALTVTITGPEVPGEGLPKVASATTCTWRVTFEAATTTVAVPVSAFSAIDHLGAVFKPEPVRGQPLPPTTVRPGQRVSFELRAVMPTGEGLMRLAPAGHIVAAWDFEVEND